MKTLMMMLALSTLASFSSSAQELCEECTMPPKSIGAGGLTCAKAAAAFQKASGAKDVFGYEGYTSYTLASEVYCVPHYGMATQGMSGVQLTFNATESEDILTGNYEMNISASLENILGYPHLSSRNNPVAFLPSGDACFSRYQLIRDSWGNWHYPHHKHYFNYQCRALPTSTDALICKVKYDGRIDIGYQVYKMNGTSSTLPEGILE